MKRMSWWDGEGKLSVDSWNNDERESPSAANGDTDENNINNNNSVPHMLIALSAGISAPQPINSAAAAQIQSTGGSGETTNNDQKQSSRKRFRSRLEQKERMLELSERLGWRMQRRDEALVEESCREIGVGKGVFKVWMHNNNHNFFVSSPRFAPPTPVIIPPESMALDFLLLLESIIV